MRRTNKRVILAVATGMLAGAAAAQSAFGPVSGDAERGKPLYSDYGCFACHGYQGIGRKNLANDASGIMVNEQVFLNFLRARANLNPRFPVQDMPNYPASSLSDEDALDIYAYIRTFRDTPPEVGDIPALQAILDAAEGED